MQTVRSLIFDLVFYLGTFIASIALLWTLLLPRKAMMAVLRFYFYGVSWIESVILGLSYQVLGRENLPDGPFILASKHQSVWETLKLNVLLDDPAVVLKHELLRIPIWGWYATRAEMIPIVRGARGAAIASLIKGARAAAAQRRPIVIFPQGTRLAPGTHRPYKAGIAALYDALDIPVVPMALNSGVFWPRGARVKRSGLITAQFLDPIPPGLSRSEFLSTLEQRTEAATEALVQSVGGPANG